MLIADDTAQLIVGLLAASFGAVFLWKDSDNPSSRALAWCMIAIAPTQWLAEPQQSGFGEILVGMLLQTSEGLAMWFGTEWARRIGRTASKSRLKGRTAQGVIRAAQILIIVYTGLRLGYLLIAPELALRPAEGTVVASGLEFAIFAPVLGTAMLLMFIALVLLLLSRIDSAEAIRLRALILAGPFFMLSLIMGEPWSVLSLTLALLIFFAASLNYLMIQAHRGQNMAQFLSPEVANILRHQGLEPVRTRRRSPITVVACDLRGFTAFAREQESERVIALLERYYEQVGALAAQHTATVKDHAGDGILILLGAPAPLDDRQDQAIRLARAVLQEVGAMLASEAPEVGIGAGIASGEATVGAIQGAGRLEYVAVGNVVNLAARLCDRAANGEILLDTDTVETLQQGFDLTPRAPETLKGFAAPVPVYALIAGRENQKQEPSPGVDDSPI